MSEPISLNSSLSFRISERWSPPDKHFLREFLIFETDFNQLKTIYNETDSIDGKLALLDRMMARKRVMDHTFPSEYFEGLTFYSQLESDLFREIKHQRSLLAPTSVSGESTSSLSELIANMSPDKRNEFAQILTGKDDLQVALGQLYSSGEAFQDEAQRYQSFMSTHSIEILGGFNSRNFKVTDMNTGQMEVLKLDNRLGKPKDIEVHLREQKYSGLMSVKMDLPISCRATREYQDAEGTQQISQLLSNMQVTEYCGAGSLLEVSQYQKKKGDIALCLSACQVMEDMAKKLIELRANNAVMLDFKPANWLWKDGELYLGDTKSFMRCDAEGVLRTTDAGNQYYDVLRSPQFFFPEDPGKDEKGANKEMELNADQFHSYVLGVNLHCFLRGEKFPCYEKGERNFDNPAYDGYLSGDWQNNFEPLQLAHRETRYMEDAYDEHIQLIGKLTKFDPDERLPIKEALEKLGEIKLKLLDMQKEQLSSQFKRFMAESPESRVTTPMETNELRELCILWKSLEFGEHDTVMRQYTETKFKEYVEHPDARQGILDDAKDMGYDFYKNGITYLHHLTVDLRNQNGFFNQGQLTKANNIEQLVCSLSPEERRSFSQHSKRDAVLDELARVVGPLGRLGEVPQDKTGKIGDKKMDPAYVDFKKRFDDQIPAQARVDIGKEFEDNHTNQAHVNFKKRLIDMKSHASKDLNPSFDTSETNEDHNNKGMRS